jgi:hypothetical protein
VLAGAWGQRSYEQPERPSVLFFFSKISRYNVKRLVSLRNVRPVFDGK